MKTKFQKIVVVLILIAAFFCCAAKFSYPFPLLLLSLNKYPAKSNQNHTSNEVLNNILSAKSNFGVSDSIPETEDEFVGPFSSWLNVKTQFGAKGDGITDDTKALQNAFNEVSKCIHGITLFIPRGNYLIKETLILTNSINLSIIGENPANTIIIWEGGEHGIMLRINGTAYSKFNRLTWNGNRKADIAIDQSWDAQKPHFDTSDEYEDDVFIDVKIGINGGGAKNGFAETSILRDRFIRNTIAGVSLGNFNALDVWVRNSIFQDCATGVTNTLGAGNFRLYNNLFISSRKEDISIRNTGGFSIRENTSVNSNQFFDAKSSRNPATIIIEGNTILDPVSDLAINISNQGPAIFINNIVRSGINFKSGPVVNFNGNSNTDIIAFGNTFTVKDAIPIIDSNKMVYKNKVVARENLKFLPIQKLPGVAPIFNRKIFEVPAGASVDMIQTIVNKASKFTGSRPVVHFPFGNYEISSTIVIPVNSDIQLVGDGYGDQFGSVLKWKGMGSGPIISIVGPSKATLRDLTVLGSANTINILIKNADQNGARVFLQEFNQKYGQIGMLNDKLDHTLVFGFDSQFSDLQKAVSVIGGAMADKGEPAEGRTVIYSGAESNNDISHQVSNGGNLLMQDTWYEGNKKSTFAYLTGKGFFSAVGCQIATPKNTNVPSVILNNFSGKATFLSNDFADRFAVTGNGSNAKLLILGILAENIPFLADSSSPKADIKILSCRARDYKNKFSPSSSYPLPDIGIYNKKNVDDMVTNSTNIHAIRLNKLPTGVTDIRIYRVMSIGGAIGLDIEADNH